VLATFSAAIDSGKDGTNSVLMAAASLGPEALPVLSLLDRVLAAVTGPEIGAAGSVA
jgi:hypothetical protein